jgi:hypothetical protein
VKDPKPGPVKSWATMTSEERARISATSKPPPPTPILPYRCNPRRSGTGEGSLQTSALCRIRETEKAVLYLLPKDSGGEVWVPKSVLVSVDGDAPEDGWRADDWGSLEAPVELEVKRWWWEKQGLPE